MLRVRAVIGFFVALLGCGWVGADESAKLKGLSGEVRVVFDSYGVPHIYADSWADAARAIGYLHAGERLWQMDMFRRQASGSTAEIVGPGGLESDILVRQLGIRRTSEKIWESDALGPELKAELQAYAEGVNARIAELGKAGLPAYFQALGYEPAPWTPIDSLVFNKYMGWDQSGTQDDLWFGMMVDKLGPSATEELWPLDRPYEEPTVETQAPREKLPAPITVKPAGDPELYAAAFRELSRAKSPFRGLSYGSNNWAVDGTKTKSGKPMLCNDPHLGFQLPSIWYMAHLSVKGRNVAGATFPGSPGVVIGHNDQIAWGITNMQSDAVDCFVETIHPDDPKKYKHRGEWKTLETIVEKIPVRGQDTHTLEIEYTVHGPLIQREKQAIALCWTGLEPTPELQAFWEIQRAENLEQFLKGTENLITPAINLCYADIHGNIAIHPCGALPLRTPGLGRVPMDGASGEFDWKGMIPRSKLPLAVNPAEHFVASANGRPAGIGYPNYLGWMWDCSYRKRRINELLAKADDLTVESMKPIQLDAHDKMAECFLPSLLESLEDDLEDPFAKQVRDELAKWDYVADRDAIGPTIWLRWLSLYRDAVWDDEWKARGIEKQGGSWGFSGTNRREPMLEVLEYITREDPRSRWFDDRGTPEIEMRDEIAQKSFFAAVASLKQEFGDDLSAWSWGQRNVLYVRSLSGEASLGRDGGPVVGDAFTLNPGGNIGRVGGGASFRMIVDFGKPQASLGVYPGGQSENPASPHYADQIPLWASGEYVPLAMESDPKKLKAAGKLTLKP